MDIRMLCPRGLRAKLTDKCKGFSSNISSVVPSKDSTWFSSSSRVIHNNSNNNSRRRWDLRLVRDRKSLLGVRPFRDRVRRCKLLR